MLAVAGTLPADARAAPPNQLSAPSVSPRAGTTGTTFVFSVSYEGRDPATAVVASVAGQTVNLALVSGTATSGSFRGESQLPAGSWTVTFTAHPARGNQPTADGGTIQVAAPTPVPTPIPTPVPAPSEPPPAAVPPPTTAPAGGAAPPPATLTPGSEQLDPQPAPGAATSDAPSPTEPLASQDAAAANAAAANAAAAPSASGERAAATIGASGGGVLHATDPVWQVLLGGLGLIGMVAASGMLLGVRQRRRQEADAPALNVAAGTVGVTPAEAPRRSALWELDAQLEDETIGTVDYLPSENGDGIGVPPADPPAAAPQKRVNPRVARMEAARAERPASARRSLLGRG